MYDSTSVPFGALRHNFNFTMFDLSHPILVSVVPNFIHQLVHYIKNFS